MPTILARVRGLVSPIFADEPVRRGDAGGGAGIATTSAPGLVQPDGTTITVNGSGIITAVGGSGSSLIIDNSPAIPTVYDDEFSGSSLDTTGVRFSGAQPWTEIGTATGLAYSEGSGQLTISSTASTTGFVGIEQAIPSGSQWAFFTKVSGTEAANNSTIVGLLVGGSNGAYVTGGTGYNSTSGGGFLDWGTFATPGSAQANAGFSGSGLGGTGTTLPTLYLAVRYDGTNVIFSYFIAPALATSGQIGIFTDFKSWVASTFLTAPANIGLFMAFGSSSSSIIAQYFRRIY